MEFDIRMTVAVVVAAVSSYLLILGIRKLLDGINKATGGKFYTNRVVRVLGILLDSVLPFLPCIPSGLLAMAIMYYWPPDALWDSSLLHFLIGAIVGSVAAQLYQTITRAIEKQAERVASKVPDPPKGNPDPPPAPGS